MIVLIGQTASGFWPAPARFPSVLVTQPWRRGPAMSRRCHAGWSKTAPVDAAVETLREAVDKADARCRNVAGPAAWHGGAVVRFARTAFGCGVADMRVSRTAPSSSRPHSRVTGGRDEDRRGLDGTSACGITSGGTDLASTAPHSLAFEQVLQGGLHRDRGEGARVTPVAGWRPRSRLKA